MVKIIYVGKKPTAFDNVARSGKTWQGNGDIQEVTEEQAKILLTYPDQWARVQEQNQRDGDNDGKTDDDDGNQNQQDGDNLNLNIPLEKMTKAELIVLAKVKYNKDFPETLPKKQLIDEIETLKAELG